MHLLKKTLRTVSFLELIYLLALPYMGYIGTGILNGKYHILPFTGFGVLFLFQTIGYAFWVISTKEKFSINSIALPVSIILTVTNFIWSEEKFWLFWVEKSLFEIGAIFLCLMAIAFVSTLSVGKSKKTDIKALPALIILLLILSAPMYETLNAWSKNVSYFNTTNNIIHTISVFTGLILDVIWLYPALYKFHRREIIMKDIFKTKFGMLAIIGQLVLWLIAVPLTLFLAGFFK